MAGKLDLSALNLSALDETPAPAGAATGKPLNIPLADIDEDPDQPRKEFSDEAMQEMTDSIRSRGVKTPVSVRPHPAIAGRWMLNYGSRRYRGSLAAGRDTVPAFIDEAHDDYDQVIENIQRDDLKPMELALFIKKRLDAGDTRRAIASNLGKDASIITQHLALIDPPACVEDAYSTGKCTSPKTLYELRGLHEKHPDKVDAWCAASTEITRRTVSAFADELNGKTRPAPTAESTRQGVGEGALELGHDQAPGGSGAGAATAAVQTIPPHNPAIERKPQQPADPTKLKKPLLLGAITEGKKTRDIMVILHRRPTSAGLVHIAYKDGSGEAEVSIADIRLTMLSDSQSQ